MRQPQASSQNMICRIENRLWLMAHNCHRHWYIAGLLAICFFSFFLYLDAFEVELMEARNFVTAREMAAGGNWWVPTMNGDIRIAKPPLPTWITAVARMLGGNTDDVFVMRLPAAMMATMMVLSVYGVLRVLSPDPLLPFLGGSVLATSLIVMDMGRRGHWDIYSHGFMMLAIWTLVRGLTARKTSPLLFSATGVFLAMSAMSKGPVSFYALLLPFLVAYLLSYGTSGFRTKWKALCLCIFSAIVLSAAWPVAIMAGRPELFESVVKAETTSWFSRHIQPVYFYLHFPLYAGIWAPFVCAGLIPSFAGPRVGHFGKYKFALMWTATAIVLLSIIPEKKERYLLPAAVPMAVTAAFILRAVLENIKTDHTKTADKRMLKVHTIVLAVVCILSPLLLMRLNTLAEDANVPGLFFFTCLYICIAVCVPVLYKNRAGLLLVLTTHILICLVAASTIRPLANSLFFIKNQQYESLDGLKQFAELDHTDVYSVDRIYIKDVWKIGKSITFWNVNDDPGLPLEHPIIVLSDANRIAVILKNYEGKVLAETLDCLRYDTRNPERIKCATLIRPLTPHDEIAGQI
ncbi:MAG: hypothetical protein HKM93_19085 [Desulfobacteraceae bacterium]|nr:hypothetical protein [Desulfobacteraceae bacterium]